MDLSTLPEDARLQVLGFLKTRELLQCRAVCRRLRDTALHPHLWRKRRLHVNDYGSGRVQLVAATLRLAPYLGGLSLNTDYRDLYLQLGTLLSTTNCAIFDLDLHWSSETAVSVAMALVRQVALGRLRSVSITLAPSSEKSDLRLLHHQLLHTQGLSSLGVCEDFQRTWQHVDATPTLRLAKAAQGGAVPASLRRLQYHSRDGSLNTFLQWHADTLEVVMLGSRPLPAGTASVLGALPRLRELHCPILEDMPQLLRLPSLRSLYLHLDGNESTRLRGVQQYLRQAGRLHTLTLEYDQGGYEADFEVPADAAILVMCLAGSGAALRSFSLAFSHTGDACRPQPMLAPLACVLHRLEKLVSLDLGGPHTAAFLEAMDGRVLPRLERLRVHLYEHFAGMACPHEWAHGAEPRALLRRYPRLHLEVEACHDHDAESPCAYCKANTCHDFGETTHVLFSHPGQERCKQKHGAVPFRVVL